MKAETATRLKDTLSTGRHTAAGVLDRAGGIIRSRSQKAVSTADDGAATAESQPRRGVRGYVAAHPRRFFLAAALLTLVLTLLLIRTRSSGSH